eukprot:TRINITY_DN80658_c0_g1_i1.p1 TRINITY_DN80658_c0_g1~~TRINITY_DN80658_c0_g1_i1.p1  ORF type:complete len:229 (-),score=36.35 TRINITY_DN80658_c0_g1_i1:72-758(-)
MTMSSGCRQAQHACRSGPRLLGLLLLSSVVIAGHQVTGWLRCNFAAPRSLKGESRSRRSHVSRGAVPPAEALEGMGASAVEMGAGVLGAAEEMVAASAVAPEALAALAAVAAAAGAATYMNQPEEETPGASASTASEPGPAAEAEAKTLPSATSTYDSMVLAPMLARIKASASSQTFDEVILQPMLSRIGASVKDPAPQDVPAAAAAATNKKKLSFFQRLRRLFTGRR